MLIGRDTRVIVQGFTGKRGSEFSAIAIEAGTNVVGGVSPGKGGESHLGLPVFDSVREALSKTDANASIVFVPAPASTNAMLEAIDAGLPLIVAPGEGVAVHDMLQIRRRLHESNNRTRLIGPNCPGIIVPGECLLGIMPDSVFSPGRVGVVTRSGTLSYEIVDQLTSLGIGQSACIGVGADPVTGFTLADAGAELLKDAGTDALVVIGEIGGTAEEDLARVLTSEFAGRGKPVFACVAGRHAPRETRMGHAGAIVSRGIGDAKTKIDALEKAGVVHISDVSCFGDIVAQALER